MISERFILVRLRPFDYNNFQLHIHVEFVAINDRRFYVEFCLEKK